MSDELLNIIKFLKFSAIYQVNEIYLVSRQLVINNCSIIVKIFSKIFTFSFSSDSYTKLSLKACVNIEIADVYPLHFL